MGACVSMRRRLRHSRSIDPSPLQISSHLTLYFLLHTFLLIIWVCLFLLDRHWFLHHHHLVTPSSLLTIFLALFYSNFFPPTISSHMTPTSRIRHVWIGTTHTFNSPSIFTGLLVIFEVISDPLTAVLNQVIFQSHIVSVNTNYLGYLFTLNVLP